MGIIFSLGGGVGAYLASLECARRELFFELGFVGLELALLLEVVTSCQAGWRLVRRSRDPEPFTFYSLSSVAGFMGSVSDMIAVCGVIFRILRYPAWESYLVVGFTGLGVAYLLAMGALARGLVKKGGDSGDVLLLLPA